MTTIAELTFSKEYYSFRSNIPQKKICVDDASDGAWTIYDAGPRNVSCPLICLPPASGRADIFFQQILSLTSAGYRVISVEFPVYWTLAEFVEGFRRLIDHLHLDKVHLFGASLGGYLAQKFAEMTRTSPRVESLILCNAFIDTAVFHQTEAAQKFWMMPSVVLKKMVMGTFTKGFVDKRTGDSVDFVAESLENLTQQQLASRLTLNCIDNYVKADRIQDLLVMIIDVNDECALTESVKDEMYKCYPNARRAQLKSGGNFPYLSRSDEVNLFIQIHLKQFIGTRYSPVDPLSDLVQVYHEAELQEKMMTSVH